MNLHGRVKTSSIVIVNQFLLEVLQCSDGRFFDRIEHIDVKIWKTVMRDKLKIKMRKTKIND